MKHFALSLALLALLFQQAFAQAQAAPQAVTPCKLTVAQSPSIRGIKLGMSSQELLALFPGSADNQDVKYTLAHADEYPEVGKAAFSLLPGRYSTKDQFAGIAIYSFVLFDGRLERFNLQYTGLPSGPRWIKVDDFITKLAEGFRLPPAQDWTPNQRGTSGTLKCDGFEMHATIYDSGSTLGLSTTLDIDKKQKERNAAYEEKKRQAFKP